ncbi:spidroin-2-like [Culicoides brevitarsis]|uniref:spidroin-2-like n=1 Tax=Culicoides brevitarsis TaxID=469753 RepID=UPI00307C3839
MKLLRFILLILSTVFVLNCEAGRGFSSRGGGSRGGGGWGSRPSSSGSSWFGSKSKSPSSPSYSRPSTNSRPAPAPSYGWNVQSRPSNPSPSASSPGSLSYPRQPAYNPSYNAKPAISNPSPGSLSYPKQPAYNPSFNSKPSTGTKPVGPPSTSGSYPKQPSTSGGSYPKQPSAPVGPPPSYPGYGTGGANPPAYSRYTPKSQAPAYNAPSYATRPNPPAYSPSAPSSQGVKPYSNVNTGSYPKQTYTSVPASHASYPQQQYGSHSYGYGGAPGGYGYGTQSHGYGYGGGHAAPVGPPVYNHYGGSAGYGYPAGPTIINNHYGGGGFGGGYGGGYGYGGGGFGSGGSGSSIGSHLLTAGLFYGLGRVTSPSYGYGYGGLGSVHRSSSSTTNVHNTYNNYYDHGSTTTSTVTPPVQAVNTDTNTQPQATNVQQPQGPSPTDIYLTQPKDPYGVIIPSNSTNTNQPSVQEPPVIIPRTVDLTKQKLYEPVEVPFDEVSKHKINEQPLWLNESIDHLVFYGLNFPTWNETTVIKSAPLVAVNAPVNEANPSQTTTTTTPKPEPEPTGLGAKIGKIFYNVVSWFSSGYKNDNANAKTPQIYLEDETQGRPEAEMLRKTLEEKQNEAGKVLT